MNFKEVKSIISGYNEYFSIMLRYRTKLNYNKKYREITIKQYVKDKDIYKDIITFNIGNLQKGIEVNIKNYYIHLLLILLL